MASNVQLATQKIISRDPATGEVLRELDCAGEGNVRAAVENAQAAQGAWAALGVRKRIEVVQRFQRRLAERKNLIASAITREAGKPIAEALTTEILVVLDSARFLIDNAFRLLREEPVPHGNIATKVKTGVLLREPYGVIGIISPWNYPFSIPATEALAALVAGNAVVLKPSEFTPLVALELVSLFHAAGVPENICQVVTGDGTTGAALLDSPIGKLVFTGSVATGKRIAAAASQRLLPVVLELGGKDPMIVFEDANLDVASSAAVWGAFMNAGQTCLSVERCYVHRSLYEEFLSACVEKTSKLRVGNGLDPCTDIGPMIHEKQLKTVEAHIADAVASGARILIGGERLAALGANFFAPTILADVTHGMRLMQEETFGPVLPVMTFDNDEEAIRLANDSEFGLAASIWTRDRNRGERIARRLQAGTVMVNDVISCFGISEAPHGGVKSSGIGRAHGHLGLEEMVRTKYVDFDRLPGIKKLWWYGYGEKFTRQMNSFIDFQFATKLMDRVRGAVSATASVARKRI